MKSQHVTTVLFDLDGTLLPMDQDRFAALYFQTLAQKLAPYGYDPEQLIQSIWAGIAAMVKNDGSRTNEGVFWELMLARYGEKIRGDIPVFEDYYRKEFQQIRSACGRNPMAAQTVHRLKELGYGVALATNPVFPFQATESRIRWAGLEPTDFAFYTSYENSSHCKPNPAYYLEVADRMGVLPEHCLMVGNDMIEDTAAAQVGMAVFILTDCLIDKNGTGADAYPNGSFPELIRYLTKTEADQ